jgi:hypothetical protein
MQVVGVRKRKLDGAWMRWAAYAVDTDPHGTWLYTPLGSIVVGERSGVSARSYVGVPDAPGLEVLHLAPAAGWWFAAWTVDGLGRRLTLDICRPPAFSAGQWSFDDLELDLWWRDGEAGVADHDEFDEACALGLIGSDERATCLATATSLEVDLRSWAAPFDELAWHRLAHLAQFGLTPLTDP